MTGSAPTDDDRMRMAIALTRDEPSPESEAVRKRSRRRWLPVLLVGVGVAAAVAWFLVSDGRTPRRNDVDGWRAVVGWMMFVGGIGSVIVGFVRTPRDQRFSRAFRRNRPFEVLTGRQRRGLLRQVQGRAEFVPSELPMTRLMAAKLAAQQPGLWTSGGLAVLLAGNALRSDSWGMWVLCGLLLILVAVSTPFTLRQARRARAFLAAHPEPTPETVP